jgi:hypothetical protein
LMMYLWSVGVRRMPSICRCKQALSTAFYPLCLNCIC